MPKIAIEAGVELEYQITGDGDPILLSVGTACSLGLWGPIVPALAERYKVIAYDHRGMGDSTPSMDAVSMAPWPTTPRWSRRWTSGPRT